MNLQHDIIYYELANFGPEIDQPFGLAPGTPDTLQLDKANR